MAQAARLSLRLQKELKQLTNDPPHGVSLLLPSDNSVLSSSSFSSIEAKIEGPEETVYSDGVFTVKVRIPERYPFQPPNVTITTPIYHPNIDNGGRICLDILNLPPKGAWQPSMSISTVLMSIRLLLSEANPDDGLMAEASREYKYNRQSFDEKARIWTEKYAKPLSTGRNDYENALISPNLPPVEAVRVDAITSSFEDSGRSRKKLRLTGHNLSHKLATPPEINNNDDKENLTLTRRLSLSHKQIGSYNSGISQNITSEVDIKYLDVNAERAPTENPKQAEADSDVLETAIVSDSEESEDECNKP